MSSCKNVLFFYIVKSQLIKNESPLEEVDDYYLQDDSSDSEEEDDDSLVEQSISKKSKTKILQPKKSYYKPKNEFTCSTCSKTFRNGERLEAHERQHLGQKVRNYSFKFKFTVNSKISKF